MMRILMMLLGCMCVYVSSAQACQDARNAMNDLEAALAPRAGVIQSAPPRTEPDGVDTHRKSLPPPQPAFSQNYKSSRGQNGASAQTPLLPSPVR